MVYMVYAVINYNIKERKETFFNKKKFISYHNQIKKKNSFFSLSQSYLVNYNHTNLKII
ncbi:hypothetical protein C1645_777266 [Glomus cerebriforme]|uniref:Uncharacterized protein n=1 Tax=Glomus cerebriforme TaxID=658196 RepID=A0A397SXJ1_9GLOM|nr:hypothetical protein C1645_777266 [Glomus cerebriforme]